MFPIRLLHPCILIIALSLTALGCSPDDSAAEKTAVSFYKSVWVEGDLDKAASLLTDRNHLEQIRWRVENTRREQHNNPAILITESPTDNGHTYLIHRPSDKRDYKIWLHQVAGRWRVIRLEQNYIPERGGYVSNDTYQRLKQEFPGLKWKRIDHP